MYFSKNGQRIGLGLFLGLFLLVGLTVGIKKFLISGISYQRVVSNQQQSSNATKVVFLFPHQDDEMFMAGAIKRNIDEGREVNVVMVTDGSASAARNVINGKNDNGDSVYNTLNKRYHNPASEGYSPLSKHDFSVARNREFYASMIALGVKPQHIFFANPGGVEGSDNSLYIDGRLNKDLATGVIKYFYEKFGQGVYYTVGGQNEFANFSKPHRDHIALRQALFNFSPIKEKYFFSEDINVGKPIKLTKLQKENKRQALQAYYVWNPTKGWFAIGKHSVKDLLDFWSNSGVEYELNPEIFR